MGDGTVGEPELDLGLGVLDAVGTVAKVTADVNAEVTTDGTGERGEGVSLTKELTASLNGLLAGPDHTNDRTGGHVGHETGEEGLGLEVLVVLLEDVTGGLHELKGLKLVTLGLETADDLANKTALDTVGLDHDVGAFHFC